MNKRNSKRLKVNPNNGSMSLLMTMIFESAFRVWQLYSGDVPLQALEELELDGDWPRGVAAAALERLTREAGLRSWIADRLDSK